MQDTLVFFMKRKKKKTDKKLCVYKIEKALFYQHLYDSAFLPGRLVGRV